MSNELLNVLISTSISNPVVTYNFVYNELKRVLKHESTGKMRVRFVSRSLRDRQDEIFKHVFLEFQEGTPLRKNNLNEKQNYTLYVAEHAPGISYAIEDKLKFKWKEEISIQLPNVSHTLSDIIGFDESVSNMYVPGINDCRHHVSNMLQLCYPIDEKEIT